MELLINVLILGIIGCQGEEDAAELAGGPVELTNLMEDYYEWLLMETPESATYYGEYKWNSRRASFNMTVFSERKAALEQYLERLIDIDPKRLVQTDKLNYDILLDTLTTYLTGEEWARYGAINPINFLEGEQLDPGFLPYTFPFESLQDYEDYLSRLAATKTQLEEYIELFKEAMRLGRTLNAASIKEVPGQIENILVDDVMQSVYNDPFAADLDTTSISNGTKTDLRRMAGTIIQDNIITPYRHLKTFLETDYKLATRVPLGVSAWDKGQEYYRACLKWHLSQDVTAEKIHKKGLAEVERISTKMLKLMRMDGFYGTIPEYFVHLKADARFRFASADDLRQAYSDILFKRINPKLNTMFDNYPNGTIQIATFSSGGPIVGFTAGSADGKTPGTLWVNIAKVNETYLFDMIPIVASAINPGNHLRTFHTNHISVPPFRKNSFSQMFSVPFTPPEYSAYTQGWALYGEAVVEELGVYEDTAELMGRYSSEIFRACRMVVDTGIHAFGWNRDQALQYLQNYTTLGKSEIEYEIDRYITWPGQACAYKYGEIKIWELRNYTQWILGDGFDVKEFHSTILNLGAVPLNIMEKAVNAMINRMLDRLNPISDTIVTHSSSLVVSLSLLVAFRLSFLH